MKEKNRTWIIVAIIIAVLLLGYCMGHRTKRFFQWSGKMGERL